MIRTGKLSGFVLSLCVTLFAGCGPRSRPAESANRTADPNSPRAFAVHVYDARPSPASSGGDLLIPAALSVESTAVVLAEREGRVIALEGRESARVKKGEILARLNDDDQRTQLQQAEIEVSRLKVEEEQYEALVKLNRVEWEREKTLAQDGVSSKANVERAQYKLDQATKEYEKTRLATRASQSRVRAVEIEIEKNTIRAPIAGVITRRHVALGTNVARNDKLFEVSNLSPLELKFQLPQSENRRLSVGQIISLSAVDSDRPIARAKIRRIDPVADATSNTFGYLADILGGTGLMPGLTVNVRLPRGSDTPSFWIPRTAFSNNSDLRNGAVGTLFIVNGQQASARSVLVSNIEGDQVEIVSGLATSDRVILMPPAGMKDKDPIEINPG